MTTNITEKTYKKIAIQIALNGFKFSVFDTLKNKPILVQKKYFENHQINSKIEDLFSNAIKENPELGYKYDEIIVLHYNNLCTFVPTALFDPKCMGSYLQFNTKIFETDFFVYDELTNYEMNNVYIPFANMNNFFIDQYGSFDYKHSSSILVSKLLDLSKNNEERKIFVHVAQNHFEMVVVQNQKLHLFNSFEYKTAEDFIYYILFVAEQLQLNPEKFKLIFFGAISENDQLYQITYKYVRNISLLDVAFFENSFSEEENREHFILLNS